MSTCRCPTPRTSRSSRSSRSRTSSRPRRRSAIAELDADRTLALTYVPAARRQALRTLWELDVALGQVIAGGREPLISQIKLAWWRDSLAKLDNARPPAEPMLEAVAANILPSGVTGTALSEMEQGWTTLLSQEPLTQADLDLYAATRGALLFRHAAALLGQSASRDVEQSGELWALTDLARHSNPADAAAALEAGRRRLPALQQVRWPKPLRPLGMLAVLAGRDLAQGSPFEQPGAPGRMLRMLRLRITGR